MALTLHNWNPRELEEASRSSGGKSDLGAVLVLMLDRSMQE